MLTTDALSDIGRVRHAFLTRLGGVSEGHFDSLNCGFGSGDDPGRVAENRALALALAGLPPGSLVTAYQTHSIRVATVDEPWARDAAPRVDALVTDRPGLTLGILTADCAPVLFADAEAGVIGAAHAGWRGALDGILEATVAAMAARGARLQRIRAAIGPAIAQGSYEVGPEFPAPFLARDAADARFFRPAALASPEASPRRARPGHSLFDLAGYVAGRLAALGLGSIERLDCDTCAEADRFFSYRRATRAGERDYGRNLSAICLER